MSNADKYNYRVAWSEEDGEHVGLCTEFPSLSWLAPSVDEAMQGIYRAVADILDDMAKSREQPPEPIATLPLKGKVLLRIPPDLHRELTVRAADMGIPLNQHLTAVLARSFEVANKALARGEVQKIAAGRPAAQKMGRGPSATKRAKPGRDRRPPT